MFLGVGVAAVFLDNGYERPVTTRGTRFPAVLKIILRAVGSPASVAHIAKESLRQYHESLAFYNATQRQAASGATLVTVAQRRQRLRAGRRSARKRAK